MSYQATLLPPIYKNRLPVPLPATNLKYFRAPKKLLPKRYYLLNHPQDTTLQNKSGKSIAEIPLYKDSFLTSKHRYEVTRDTISFDRERHVFGTRVYTGPTYHHVVPCEETRNEE